jgi:hypothetical protein
VPAIVGPWVRRVLYCHAFSEAPRMACAAISYNNTPKDFIANLYCLIVDVAAFRLVLLASLMLFDGKVVALNFWENSINLVELN